MRVHGHTRTPVAKNYGNVTREIDIVKVLCSIEKEAARMRTCREQRMRHALHAFDSPDDGSAAAAAATSPRRRTQHSDSAALLNSSAQRRGSDAAAWQGSTAVELDVLPDAAMNSPARWQTASTAGASDSAAAAHGVQNLKLPVSAGDSADGRLMRGEPSSIAPGDSASQQVRVSTTEVRKDKATKKDLQWKNVWLPYPASSARFLAL